jgi:hypothetical protein
VGEHPELAAAQPEEQVLRADEGAYDGVPWRVAEHDLPAGVVGDRAEQRRVVGVAAHDPVQDDDVRRLDLVRAGRDVDDAPVGAAGQAGVGEQPPRLGLVRRRQLEVGGAGGAALEQLHLDVADATADLQHGRALEPALGDELDHPPGGPVQAPLAIPVRRVPGEPVVEHPVAAARVAAARHDATIPPSRSDGICTPGRHAPTVERRPVFVAGRRG